MESHYTNHTASEIPDSTVLVTGIGCASPSPNIKPRPITYLSNGNTRAAGEAPCQRLPIEQQKSIDTAGRQFLKETGETDDDACMLITGTLGQYSGPVLDSTENAVARCCQVRYGYPQFPPNETRVIDLVLQTGGGSLDSAFKVVLFLLRYTKRLRVFVPHWAKSAGTLIAIGANEMFLSPFAELGPLDTQIHDPRNPVELVSALDCYRSVDYVRDFGLRTLRKAFENLGESLGEMGSAASLSELVGTAKDFSVGCIDPILSSTKALDFGGWGRTLEIGALYAKLLLTEADYSQNRIEEIPERLVYNYTHHLFPVDLDEAKRIGLRAKVMTKSQYETAHELVSLCTKLDGAVGFIDGKSDKECEDKELESATQAPRGAHGSPHTGPDLQATNGDRGRAGTLAYAGEPPPGAGIDNLEDRPKGRQEIIDQSSDPRD